MSVTDVLFDAQGRVSALRQHWTFDEMYSAYAAQGLGDKGKPPTSEALAPLARTNVESLAEFGYFTSAKVGGRRLDFEEPSDYSLEADDKLILTLNFTLRLKTPVDAKKPFSFQTSDPTYFVAFSVDKGKAATMVGAPAGCSMSEIEPAPLMAADQTRLDQAKAESFSPGLDLSMRMATRVVVACP